MTIPNRPPMLHRNARSRQIKSSDVRKVFAQETSRFLRRGLPKDVYLRSVMP
ncbi:hypothetical protein SEA_NEDARYA_56 [Gordonia phage Nedarya]|nr:hypothetical protein SEA_NEDARYA_56 [Gordonia phage Nedarya]